METEKEYLFNEEFYFNKYPDVKNAVIKGDFRSGYHHFFTHGRGEGREFMFYSDSEYFIDKVNNGWSKHLTLQGYVEPDPEVIRINIVPVPDEFKLIQNIEYPKGNKIPFERYFEKKFKELKPQTLRRYLPIYWTGYYVNNEYGRNEVGMNKLQKFIDSLDRSFKYFTIVQYDDGILNDLKDLDILVYSMGCSKPGYYPIPLISQPLNNTPSEEVKKDILYSFYGSDTHPIRQELVKELNNKHVKLEVIPEEKYYDILSRSTFNLCPRGYGLTSFRMFEGMHYGSIPVYISDIFWEPFNLPFTEYGIKIYPEQVKDIPKILKEVNIEEKRSNLRSVYENFFVYSSCFNSIIKTLV